jgi:PKD repeat protein
MKKLMFIFAIVLIFVSCNKYEFQEEEYKKILDTEIQLKSLQSSQFMSLDTATITANIQVILKAVTINGNPTQWFWDFGDGDEGQGQQVDHLYQDPGIYDVSVIAIDGNYSNESEIVIVVESAMQAVFSLHSADAPNNQGEIRYVVSGSKEYIPNPPVPENGPFGYQGSDPQSDWDVNKIYPDTSSTRVYWEILTHNAVYSQAYGGYDAKNNFTWAVMDDSRFYSYEYDHPRIGFLNGELVEEENFESEMLGSSGDSGNSPEIRFEINEDESQLNVYINIFDYSEAIDSPKARFKVNKEDTWSSLQDTEWVGGSGYVKYTTPINGAGEYRLRIEPDQYDQGVYTNMNSSSFYKAGENCFVWQIVEVDGEKSAQVP